MTAPAGAERAGVLVPLSPAPRARPLLVGLAALADDGDGLAPCLVGGDLALSGESPRPFVLVGLAPGPWLDPVAPRAAEDGAFPWTPRGGRRVERIAAFVESRPGPPSSGAVAGPAPFAAGVTVGWIGHELGASALTHYRTLVHLDGSSGQATLIAGSARDAGGLARLVRRAESRGRHLLAAGHPDPIGARRPSSAAGAAFADRVRAVQERIAAGDVYQVNLSHDIDLVRSTGAGAGSLAARALAFARLHAANPVPFPSFVSIGATTVMALSPERYCARRGGRIESRPIKGTRPRGRSAAEDGRLAGALLSSEKDRAENVMIVDLVRNDLGRVARTGTVSVPELCRIESFTAVHHLVSTVVADLRRGVGLGEILAAVHPAGSMTGAPKIRAVEILRRLEGRPRGPYAGGIGWFAGPERFDLAMVIRSVVIRDGRAILPVGAGIVADSDPEGEFLETLDKARSLLAAVEMHDPAAIRESLR